MKHRLSRWPLGFPIRTILAIFYLQDTPMLPTKFQVNWPFGSGEEANQILIISMHISSLVKRPCYLLKLSSGNENMGVSWAYNSVKI